MKKFSIVSAVMVALIGGALAASVNVPFFVDSQTPGGSTGILGFIALKNTTGSAIVATFDYTNDVGQALGTAGTATGSIPSGATLSYRPAFHGSVDGVGESTAAAALPNRPTLDSMGGVDTKTNGSVRITWIGAVTDIQGRYQESNLDSNSVAMYLLPPGN